MGYGLSNDRQDTKASPRTVVLASGDIHFRENLRRQLTAMRWTVREASGGAEAMAELRRQPAEAMVLDSVLPDLEVSEFARQMRSRHPVMELVWADAPADETTQRSPRRNELLHALRQAQEARPAPQPTDTVAWAAAPVAVPQAHARLAPAGERALVAREVTQFLRARAAQRDTGQDSKTASDANLAAAPIGSAASARPRVQPLPEMVGESAGMVELARLVRLVAPRSATVLVQGETGTARNWWPTQFTS